MNLHWVVTVSKIPSPGFLTPFKELWKRWNLDFCLRWWFLLSLSICEGLQWVWTRVTSLSPALVLGVHKSQQQFSSFIPSEEGVVLPGQSPFIQGVHFSSAEVQLLTVKPSLPFLTNFKVFLAVLKLAALDVPIFDIALSLISLTC